MKKGILIISMVFLAVSGLSAQTLFTYGPYSVDAKDFLRAFNKNNTVQGTARSQALKDYLQLYINSRLRIREAYDRKYDTLLSVKNEVENLRKQISENFMNDPQIVPRLQREAFERSQKDIHVAHIFISFSKNEERDTARARSLRDEILQRLKKGEDFGKLAREFSDDTTARKNSGDLGYITVFTLPYEIENVVYATPPGKFSPVITSRSGYHIFKNLGERKALGKMKAKQILLAIPPGADENSKKKIAALADSLYKALMKGSDFSNLASKYSNDYISAANNGTMPDISVGDFNQQFESVVWGLTKDGEISKPFQTSHGWHIVQRLSLKPVVTDSANQANKLELLNKMITDSRWKSSKDFIFVKVSKNPGIKKAGISESALWETTDSLALHKNLPPGSKLLDTNAPLVTLGKQRFTVMDFINYAAQNRFSPNGEIKTNPELFDDYLHSLAYTYYQDNLEMYNEEFRNQMAEFRDGNIFFEIMQQEVWNKAQNDSTALLALYEKNKEKYNWNKSAVAVIFYCTDEANAKFIYNEVKKDPSAWKRISEQYAEKVVADSSRFEWDQLPSNVSANPARGTVSAPVVNQNDNSASFAYIISVSTTPLQRSFSEAKGLVINDYQEMLEKNWTDSLRRKYPVKVNEKVLQEISK